MVSINDRKEQGVREINATVRRRRLLSLGTLLTGVSAISGFGASSAKAAPPPGAYVPIAEKGMPTGVATLDVDAKIPPAQLPNLSATILDVGKATFAPSAAGSFDSALNASFSTVGTAPLFLDAVGEYIYGTSGNALFRATTETGPWTTVKDFGSGAGINGVRLLGNGEILLIRSRDGLWKSSGWLTNPLTAKWSQVLVTNGRTTQFSIDVDPGSGWVTATTYINGDMTNSRYVWLSKNNAATFTQIFDMATAEPAINQAHSHMHIAAMDPYVSASTPRIWISYHKTPDDPTAATSPMARIKYSDDAGASWVNFSDSEFQPVAAMATPDGMLFGSDENIVGLYIVRHAAPADLKYELFHPIRQNIDGMFGWATKAVRGSNGAVYFIFRSSVAGYGAHVVATDGRRAAEVLEVPPAASGDAVDLVDITEHKGRLLGVYYNTVTNPTTAWKFTADAPRRGVPATDSRGGIAGGLAESLGTAAGLKSAAAMRGTATGANATAAMRATALGEQATAAAEATALGSEAKAAGTGVAVGRLASAADGVSAGRNATSTGDGMALGPGTNACAESVALGSFATATGPHTVSTGRVAKASGDSAVAIGYAANASGLGATSIGALTKAQHEFSMALGYGTETTAPNQVAVGAKTLLVGNAPQTPAAPTTGGIIFIEAGALKYRGSSGTITVIAPA